MRIIDGRTHFRAPLAEVVLHPRSIHQRNAARYGVKLKDLTDVDETPIKARLNHGRWIAECPDCKGAEFVHVDEPLFLCANCLNAAVGNKWRTVTVPNNRVSIERIMLARPMPMNRNWKPGETLGRLKAENRERGLPEEV